MSRQSSPATQSRLDARELDSIHDYMQKAVAKLNDLMDDAMNDYISNADKIKDGAVEKMRDLEEEMGQTLKKMVKDVEKEKRWSMQTMKDLVKDFRKEMYGAEEKILQYSRSVAERPVLSRQSPFEPFESPNSGGAGSSASGLQSVPKGRWGGGGPPP
eukprot:10491892-Karenia_brevis.AAC.1